LVQNCCGNCAVDLFYDVCQLKTELIQKIDNL